MNVESMKNLFSKSKSKRSWLIAISSFVMFASIYGFLIYQSSKHTVAISLNGEEQEVVTQADTIKDLLDELDVSYNSKDYVYPALDKKVSNNMKIIWKPAKQVEIVMGNERKEVWTTASTVEQLLKDQDIQLGESDKVTPPLAESITKDIEILIEPAFALRVMDGKKEKEVFTTSTTVADFLTQQGITLGELDRVEPSLNEVVKANDTIHVIRVEKVTDVVEEPVDFTVVTQKDSSLTKGTEKVIQNGSKGTVEKTYEIVKENGKEISRKLVKEDTVQDSQNKIVAVGTKVITAQVSRGTNTSTSNSSTQASASGKEFYVSSTAYTASCNGCSGITATGINLNANPGIKVIAVDPSIIPLGTKVYVEGYGYAIAADTGGAIKGYKIDVFVGTKTEAYQWGRRQVKIKILN
ncbi:ubiquitin-like domain-containing protein [Bacillus sp. 2205SS5-2]|uniref:ubiquitin-like domain-containing protein n=1 Tax=Bacillus sp. 2205SS5-2 TaxID=3109031 RepID=UPI0030073D95